MATFTTLIFLRFFHGDSNGGGDGTFGDRALLPSLFLLLLLITDRHLLVDEEHEAYVWQDVNEVGSETLVKPPRPLVPVSVPDALESAVVVTVLVLKARPHNLVRVRRYGGDKLGQGGEEYVFSGSLKIRTDKTLLCAK